MFIDKLCTDHNQLYVMRQVRVQGSSGENAKFREHLLKAQQAQASATRKKVQDGENKNRAEIARLTAVGLIVDCVKISKMTVPQLNDQLSIHRKFLNDEVLLEVPQKDIKYKFFKLTAVLAAIAWNEEKIGALRILIENMQESVANSGNLGESELIDDENQQDSDEEDEESYEQDFN
ncbi:hypothetical protein CVT25_006634 [Psilocybe cyanescens]|uniref:Uncharacterized protein n=1 Tax=Psilocybe cyanescens TaxID=93625 RepID=A0A409XIS6_PSICY|nr:hypothetical protein CVT25_006634 [Psilocybe cyanescens]